MIFLFQGRFHHVLYVGPPNQVERLEILEYFCNKFALPLNVSRMLSDRLREGMSGADIEILCREESMKALKSELLLL